MNKFGTFAMKTWQALAPTEFSKIENPNQFFFTLGETANQAWITLVDQMTAASPQEPDYLKEVGRLNSIRQMAEELIRVEYCTPPMEVQEEVLTPEELEEEREYELNQARLQLVDLAIEVDWCPEALQMLKLTPEVLGKTPQEMAEARLSAAARGYPLIQTWEEALEELTENGGRYLDMAIARTG